jgi:hypothetical protein
MAPFHSIFHHSRPIPTKASIPKLLHPRTDNIIIKITCYTMLIADQYLLTTKSAMISNWLSILMHQRHLAALLKTKQELTTTALSLCGNLINGDLDANAVAGEGTLRHGKGKGGKVVEKIGGSEGEGEAMRWTDVEKTQLFEYLLGADNDRMFEKLRDYKKQAIEKV